jgi:predicted peroxiredoxin
MAIELTDYMLYVGTHGMEDPMRAGLIFSAANAAKRNGYTAVVALLGDAVFLLNDTIAKETKPMGRLSLLDLVQETVKLQIPIHC